MHITKYHLEECIQHLADQAALDNDAKAVMDLLTVRNYLRFDAGFEDNDVIMEFC